MIFDDDAPYYIKELIALHTHISLEEAISLMTEGVSPLGSELTGPATGRILEEDITAPLDQPPFDRSPLDGYALRAGDTTGADRETPIVLQVVDYLCAGDVPRVPLAPGQAARIMTGAMLPAGCDCVIRQEDTDRGGQLVQIYTPMSAGQNYIHRGEDYRAGAVLLSAGTRLDAAALGLLAGAGLTVLPLRKLPRVGILCTGDEVVSPFTHPLPPGKIYGSNGDLLRARLEELGIQTILCGNAKDDPRVVANSIQDLLHMDLVITTGGVSEGDKDILHEALPLLAAEPIFWRLNLKPGSPALFSQVNGTPILSLSGNPFAAAATFELLARPLLAALSGESRFLTKRVSSVLDCGFPKSSNITRYIRGKWENGRVSLPGKDSSGVLSSLVGCNCLVELPPGTVPLQAGDLVDALLL